MIRALVALLIIVLSLAPTASAGVACNQVLIVRAEALGAVVGVDQIALNLFGTEDGATPGSYLGRSFVQIVNQTLGNDGAIGSQTRICHDDGALAQAEADAFDAFIATLKTLEDEIGLTGSQVACVVNDVAAFLGAIPTGCDGGPIE